MQAVSGSDVIHGLRPAPAYGTVRPRFNSFFGGGFGGGFGQGEEETPKGHDVHADLYCTLKDLYLGKEMVITRVKSVVKPASGTRECKCRTKLVTKQLGPGMYQQFQQQVRVARVGCRVGMQLAEAGVDIGWWPDSRVLLDPLPSGCVDLGPMWRPGAKGAMLVARVGQVRLELSCRSFDLEPRAGV